MVCFLEGPLDKPAIREAWKDGSLEGITHKPDIRESKKGLLFGGADFINLTLGRARKGCSLEGQTSRTCHCGGKRGLLLGRIETPLLDYIL